MEQHSDMPTGMEPKAAARWLAGAVTAHYFDGDAEGGRMELRWLEPTELLEVACVLAERLASELQVDQASIQVQVPEHGED